MTTNNVLNKDYLGNRKHNTRIIDKQQREIIEFGIGFSFIHNSIKLQFFCYKQQEFKNN